MRLIFTASGGPARLYPVIPLAWACRAAGHDVRLAGTPDLATEAIHSGLSTVVAEETGDLVALARGWRPDLIVHDPVGAAGPAAAATVRVPNVRLRHGIAAGPPRTTATLVVDPTPPSMRLTDEKPLLDMRYVPYNGSGAVPDWLVGWLVRTAGSARVCVTAGSITAAIADLDAEVLTLDAGVPLELVVPHCDLLVHEGADETTLTAAAYGVPQLAITADPGAEEVGGRIAAVGAGLHLRRQELTADPAGGDTIRSAVEKLLADPAFRDAARRLREEIEQQPSPAQIVAGLEALADSVAGVTI